MRILVPLDGSTLAETALAPAATLARLATAPVTVVLARVNPLPSGMIANYASLAIPAAYEDGEGNCRAYLHQIAQRADLRGLTVATSVATGLPDVEIRNIVSREKIDLIIMTSHGRGGIAQSFWGSVAQAIVHTSGVPTLVLRQHSVPQFVTDSAYPFTILVPLDESALAEAILPAAVRIAVSCGGALYLVRIVPPASELATIHQAAEYLERIQLHVEAQGIAARSSVQQGEPAPIIEQMARQLEPALLALATHGRVGLDQVLHGSTTQTLFHHLTLPILVVHPMLTPEDVAIHAIRNAV